MASLDLSKLSPAPFTVSPDSATVLDAAGGAVAHFLHGSTPETKAQAFRDAHSYATMRNALDVMLRRNWIAFRYGDHYVVNESPGKVPVSWAVQKAANWPDPFTAMVEADKLAE